MINRTNKIIALTNPLGFSWEKLPPQRVMRGHPERFVRTYSERVSIFYRIPTQILPLLSPASSQIFNLFPKTIAIRAFI